MPSKKKDVIIRSIYPGHLNTFTPVRDNAGKYVRGEYAGRFPSSFIADAATTTYGGNATGTGLVDPYNATSKRRFEDTYRADSTARNALNMLVKIVLGKKHESVLDTRKQYASDDLRKKAIESVMSQQENQNLIAEIKEIEEKVHFHERLMASDTQKHIFGRSAVAVVLKEGLPNDLKVFASKNLGLVKIDKDWKLSGVEYYDGLIKKQEFKASEILYFTNLDYNVTPNTLYHGLSTIEGIAHASETKRIILEEDLKETAKGLWAGTGVIKAPNIVDGTNADSLINAFDPGKWNLINQDVMIEVHQIANNIDKLGDLIDKIDRYIIRGIGVPLPLLGFEDVTNRATMQEVMQAYHETVIEFQRSVLQSQIDTQWYDTLVEAITEENPLELEYRVRLEFQDLVFETMKDKATAIKMMEEAGVPLPLEEKLIMLGKEHLLDQVQELEQEKKQEEQQMMEEKAAMFERQFKQ